MFEHAVARLSVLAPAAVVSLFVSVGLIVLLRPWLARHALAHPNTRSSHHAPTPQGGGLAVVVASISVGWLAMALAHGIIAQEEVIQLAVVTAAAILLAALGAIDDMRGLQATPRLAVQCVAVGMIIAALPSEWRILPHLPWWVERACLLLGGLWFVNLVNFMDGIDWMTVAELVPILCALCVLAIGGDFDLAPALLAAALLGALLGFAPFNKPVARLFLGDVGSLPLGLLLGWLLLRLAASGQLVAALILPLFYLADATVTLAWRLAARRPFWQAHRTHFYQRAIDRGHSVTQVIARVLGVNLVLAALALSTIAAPRLAWAALAAAAALVAWLLLSFVRERRAITQPLP
ncbi:MAG: glycosyl transferase [Alphaproteobacteria bacterium]|nr:MAG: glycosyl transferase [Alphaproteobacteria bacterium]